MNAVHNMTKAIPSLFYRKKKLLSLPQNISILEECKINSLSYPTLLLHWTAFKDYFCSCSCILSCQWLCEPKDRIVNSLHFSIKLQFPHSRGPYCVMVPWEISVKLSYPIKDSFILPQTQLQNQQHQETQANGKLVKRCHGAIWATESDTASKCHWGAVKSHLNSSATEGPTSTTKETQMLYVSTRVSLVFVPSPFIHAKQITSAKHCREPEENLLHVTELERRQERWGLLKEIII